MNEWKPIKTAPVQPFNQEMWFKQHSPILMLWIGRPVIGAYEFTRKGKGGWKENGYCCKPTHWMPLPDAPK